MPLLAINIVRYNQEFALLECSLQAALQQDLSDFEVVLTENGSADSIKDQLLRRFGANPRFRYAETGTNRGFSGGHNHFIHASDAEFVLPLNPDTELTPAYARNVLAAFLDPEVAAAEGKMLKPNPLPDGTAVLDGTGMSISRTRRAGERGQLQPDRGQFDQSTDVFGVSATAAIYRKSALERVKHGKSEYFDEDLFTYWEDLDLAWRLRLGGYSCRYVPHAVVYHSRSANQSKDGIVHIQSFVKNTRSLSLRVAQWDWRNHLLTIVKNDFGASLFRDLPRIVTRELALLLYFLAVRPRVLLAIPELLRMLPRILLKRRLVQNSRVVSSKDMGRWFAGAER